MIVLTISQLGYGAVDRGAKSASLTRVPPSPSDEVRRVSGYGRVDYETSFCETAVGRHAAVYTQTSIGVPGTVPLHFGFLMRGRYPEFDLTFTCVDTDGNESHPYTLEEFTQTSPNGWMPGCISKWRHGSIAYGVTTLVVPNEVQPFDVYEITLKNIGRSTAQGELVVTLDGAPTLVADGDVISDRGKPLVIMDPVVCTQDLWRESGIVDPRATAAAPWEHEPPDPTIWWRHRNGWHGMPIEYLLKVEDGEELQVFLGYHGTPNITTPNWDEPRDSMEPDIRDLHSPLPREVIASVEGDRTPQRLKTERLKHVVQKFIGRDADGDGYVHVTVQATPESRQPALVNWIRAYRMDQELTPDLVEADVDGRIGEVVNDTEHHAGGPGAFLRQLPTDEDAQREMNALLRHGIDVGKEFNDSIPRLRSLFGEDPTVFALRLRYDPTLEPGEERRYLLRLPAIDRQEPAPYGNPHHPWETGESWRVHLEPRYPDNDVPYGEDVPPEIDPTEYAVHGPKPRDLWERQVESVRCVAGDEAMERVTQLWNDYAAPMARFITPEPELDAAYKHSVAVLALNQTTLGRGELPIHQGGPFFYWDFTPRDCAYQYVATGYAGLLDAHKALVNTLLTPRSQLPRSRWTLGQWDCDDPDMDGVWSTRTRQWDAQGQTIWAALEYWLMSGDMEWLAENYPKVARGANWIVHVRERERQQIGDPDRPEYGLLPPGSGEGGGRGHSYYVNSFAHLGLRMTARAARALGNTDDAERYDREADDLKAAVQRSIEKTFVRLNDFAGTIPEVVEGAGTPREGGRYGTSFPGALLYPGRVLGPHDPLMNAYFQYREREGSSTGGLMVWPYIYVDWALGYVLRGEPDRAVDLLYCYLANASTTYDWSEIQGLDGTYDEFTPSREGIVGGGDCPHSEASSNFVHFLRNLMLMEEDDSLHIAPATARKWLGQSSPIGVENAPSHFGPVTYYLTAQPDGERVDGEIQLDPARKPKRLFIHVRGPVGRDLRAVEVNGETWENFYRETVVVPDPPAIVTFRARWR